MAQSTSEKANPVFNTAKLTLFWLARSGDEAAARYMEALGMDAARMEASVPGSDSVLLPSMISLEHRFNTFNRLILETGLPNVLDLACGYAPRAPFMAAKGLSYVGGDLPVVIEDVAPVATAASEGLPGTVAHRGVDVTNYASLKAAADLLEGPVCVVTEGLIMYLTLEEKRTVCQNIRRILAEHGGCWLLQDINAAEQYFAINGALWGEDALAHILEAKKLCDDESDTSISANGYATEDDAVRAFNEAGLDVERIKFNIDGARLRCFDLLDDKTAEALAQSLAGCHAWKVTAAEGFSADDEGAATGTGDETHVDAAVDGGVLHVRISGRLDSLSAPELIERFEAADRTSFSSALVDAQGLEYISSAGLRVLLIMSRDLGAGRIAVVNACDMVLEVLRSTGIDGLVRIA